MAPIKVVVSGSGNIKRQPELGVVSIRILSTGPDQAPVSAEVRSAAQDIQAQIRQLAAPQHADYRAPSPAVDAAVTRWSSGSVSTRSYWEDGDDNFYGARTHVGATSGYSSDSSRRGKKKKRTKVYEASVGITATFRDFDSLSDFTTTMSMAPLASVRAVEWCLTDETQARLREDALKQSYKDALAKARAFAEAMDKESVKPVQVTQANDQPPRLMAMGAARYAAAPMGAGESGEEQRLTYVPEDVSYDVDCEVTFEVE